MPGPELRIDEFRIAPGQPLALAQRPSRSKRLYSSKKHYEPIPRAHVAELSRLQSLLYACNRQARNGTRDVKFFLHLSREEQRKRLLARIDDPHKNWQFSLSDVKERRLWNQYMKAYEQCLAQTSTAESPWYAVPADDKKNARLIVFAVVLETLRGLGLDFPQVSAKHKAELRKLRKLLRK